MTWRSEFFGDNSAFVWRSDPRLYIPVAYHPQDLKLYRGYYDSESCWVIPPHLHLLIILVEKPGCVNVPYRTIEMQFAVAESLLFTADFDFLSKPMSQEADELRGPSAIQLCGWIERMVTGLEVFSPTCTRLERGALLIIQQWSSEVAMPITCFLPWGRWDWFRQQLYADTANFPPGNIDRKMLKSAGRWRHYTRIFLLCIVLPFLPFLMAVRYFVGSSMA